MLPYGGFCGLNFTILIWTHIKDQRSAEEHEVMKTHPNCSVFDYGEASCKGPLERLESAHNCIRFQNEKSETLLLSVSFEYPLKTFKKPKKAFNAFKESTNVFKAIHEKLPPSNLDNWNKVSFSPILLQLLGSLAATIEGKLKQTVNCTTFPKR